MQHAHFETAHNHYATRLVFGDTDDLYLAHDSYVPPEVRPEYQRQLRRLEQEAASRDLSRSERRIVAALKVTALHTFTIPALVTGLTQTPDGVYATFLCADQDVPEQHRSLILDAQGRRHAPVIQGE